MRITARRNSRSFAAPQKIPAAKQRLPAAVPSPHSAAAFPHASALCIRPSHSLPALKIPLKIDPLCFMPAPDCAPRTARQNRASFRGPFPHFKRHGKRPASAKSRPLPDAVCARLHPNSTASLSPGLRRIHSGKIFAPPRCTGRKNSRHFPLPPVNKSHPFLFLPIDRGTRPSISSAFSQLSARISQAAISSPAMTAPLPRGFAETVPADIRRPACFPLKTARSFFTTSAEKWA